MSNHRKLDIIIAHHLLHLDVLGEAPCWRDASSGRLEVSWDEYGDEHPVYLAHCWCKYAEPEDTLHFGHIAGCLEVVPLYHLDDTLARQALETICDECRLFASCTRIPTARWWVSLKDGSKEISIEYDASLALAICKALVGLEEQTNETPN